MSNSSETLIAPTAITPPSAVMHLHVGMDDIGSGSANHRGWTCVILPEVKRAAFDRDAAAALALCDKGAFHAKRYERRDEAAYRAFLGLIDRTLSSTLQGRAIMLLHDPALTGVIASEAQKLVSDQAKKRGWTQQPNGPATLGEAQKLAMPLALLMKRADWLGPHLSMQVEIDASQKLQMDGSACIQTQYGVVSPLEMVAEGLNPAFAKKSKRIPTLGGRVLDVLKDERSFLVQAADVWGNFSMAYLRRRLGATGATQDEKVSLFEDVLGAKLAGAPVPPALSLKGSELVIGGGGVLHFELRWVVANPGAAKGVQT